MSGYKPSLVPSQQGSYTPRNAPMTVCDEQKRRPDVQKNVFGHGVPTLGCGYRDHVGLPECHGGDYRWMATEEGAIKMPVGPSAFNGTEPFQPTVAQLTVAPYRDSRYPTISDRYYK